MTRNELRNIYKSVPHCKVGYCCYQDDGIYRCSDGMYEIGSNHGYYGWNWTAYLFAPTNTLYISCYRNVPSDIREK